MRRLLAALALLIPLAASAQVAPSRGTSTGQVWDVRNVVWTSLVNVTASGNTLTKTGGAADWDAGAISTQTVASGDVFVEWTAVDGASTNAGLGLSFGTNSAASINDVEYWLHANKLGGQLLQVYENGAVQANNLGIYLAGDILRVQCINGVVTYAKNGSILYTSSKAPSYPLYVDSTIFHINTGVLTNVRIGIPTTTVSTRHP